MNKKIFTTIFLLIVMSGIALFFFIRYSNNHKECEDIVSKTKDREGNIVTTTNHICKEKYSF